VWVGIDVGKYALHVVLAWSGEEFERPWVVKNPLEVKVLLEKLLVLAEGRTMVIAMEPSGSYGDPLRQALSDAKLSLHWVSPKAAHDHAESFDGVPSQHDGKDAAVVAELARIGRAKPWKYEVASDWEQELELQVDRAECSRRLLQLWSGRIEGKLARHWPEVLPQLKVQSSTLLQTLREYGGPDLLAADPQAAKQLSGFGRGYLTTERRDQVLEGAKQTVGVRLTTRQRQQIQDYAAKAWAAREELKAATRKLTALAKQQPTLLAMGQVVGVATACVLWAYLGDVHHYHCSWAYVKAMGLNLKERSSGIWQGKLKISKRGFGAVRAWMYLAAMRQVRSEPARSWYLAKKQKDQEHGKGALVGIMRRLGRAVYAVGTSGEAFDARRLIGKGHAVKEVTMR
jgi:transposase